MVDGTWDTFEADIIVEGTRRGQNSKSAPPVMTYHVRQHMDGDGNWTKSLTLPRPSNEWKGAKAGFVAASRVSRIETDANGRRRAYTASGHEILPARLGDQAIAMPPAERGSRAWLNSVVHLPVQGDRERLGAAYGTSMHVAKATERFQRGANSVDFDTDLGVIVAASGRDKDGKPTRTDFSYDRMSDGVMVLKSRTFVTSDETIKVTYSGVRLSRQGGSR